MHLWLRRVGWQPFAFLIALVLTLLLIPVPAYAAAADGAPASAGSVIPSTAMWGLIVGIVTPPLVAIIQRPTWSKATRTYVGAAVAVVFAALTCWVDGSIGHGETLLVTFGTVLVASQTTYREFWSKVGATQRIEAATSPTVTTPLPPAADNVFPAAGSAPDVEPPVKAPAKRATTRKPAGKAPAKRTAATSGTPRSRRSGTSR